MPLLSPPRPQANRTLVHLRTLELAARAGRPPPYVTQADYEQAKRDVTGEIDAGRQDDVLNAEYAAEH